MTDEELIARLREIGKHSFGWTADQAADRIEALVKQCEGLAQAAMNNGQALILAEDRAARLTAALVEHNDLLRSALAIAKREGIEGQIASTNWDAYYNRVAVVLKHHHQTANDARAALKGEGHDG